MSIQPAWTRAAVLDDGSLTTAKLADPAGMPTVRSAAGFSGGVGGSQAVVSWAPSTQAWSWEVTVNIASDSIGSRVLDLPGIAGLPNITFSAGFVRIRANTTDLVAIPWAGRYDQDVRLRLDTTGTLHTVSLNGEVIGSSATPITWGTSASDLGIGRAIVGGNSLKGRIYDVRLIDPASAANSAFFALDGDFRNTAPGSSVADATPSGVILWPTVLSTAGSDSPLYGLPPGWLTAAGTFAPTLPTSDPAVAGVLWNDAGTVKVSAG